MNKKVLFTVVYGNNNNFPCVFYSFLRAIDLTPGKIQQQLPSSTVEIVMIRLLVKINNINARIVMLGIVVEVIVEGEEHHRRRHLFQSQSKKNGMLFCFKTYLK